jgi:hypothetical protein
MVQVGTAGSPQVLPPPSDAKAPPSLTEPEHEPVQHS